MAVRPNFPLPKGYFGPVSLSKEQEERYREIVRKRLETALAEEYDFAVVRKRQVDANKWKLYKSKNQLHTYKRRATTVVLGEHKHGSMLCVGRIEGSLEDMIYGTYDKTHEEMKVSMKYIDTTTKDCTVLHTIDLATPTDPFHYLGFKYFVTKFPGGFVIKDRDWPYLEACGIERDSTGRRYGYLIFHAVNLPNVPAFDRADVVRGQLFFTFLFREHDGGFIDIFSQGYFDPAGDVIASFSAIMTQETLMVVSKAPKCAEAKKLTILALTYFSDKSQLSQHRCSVCTSTGGLFSSLRVCRICGATVCSKCRVKKFIFAGRNHAILNISCCPPCVLKAKTMNVRPAEEAFSVLAEKHLPEELFRSESSQFSDPPEVPTPRDALEDKSTVCGGDSDDDERYNQSVSSTMSEDEMEGMIEAMMRQKLQNTSSSSRRGGPEIDSRVLLEGGEQSFPSARSTPRSTPRTHVPQYDNGAFFPPQPAGMGMGGPPLPMHHTAPVRSTSSHQGGEFEFRNLNHHPQPTMSSPYHHQHHHQPQPQYAPPLQQQPQQYLHPADVRNMKANDFIAMGSQYHTEFRNLNPNPNPNLRAGDFRSPSEYLPAHLARPQSQSHSPYDYHHHHSSSASSLGPSDDFRGLNGAGVPLAMPSTQPQQQMAPPVSATALDYRSLTPQQVAALNARQATMGPPQPGMAPHQAELFHKMVALQNSAQQVYAITKQNEEYMRNLHT